jgi:hypothetical protein
MNNLQMKVKSIIERELEENPRFTDEVLEHGCQSGIVSELIYTVDTHKWFDSYYEDIMELVEEYEESTGEQLRWSGDLKNWFAWFSFEETVRQLTDFQ